MATRKKKLTSPVINDPNQPSLFTAGSLVVIKAPTSEEITQALAAAQLAVSEIHTKAESLVITDLTTYRAGDAILGEIMDGEKVIEEKMSPVIKLLREPLDTLYELRRGVAKPLEADKTLVKTKMGAWQLSEKQRLDTEQIENDKKALELQVQWQKDNPPQVSDTWVHPNPVPGNQLAPPQNPVQRQCNRCGPVYASSTAINCPECAAFLVPVNSFPPQPPNLGAGINWPPCNVCSAQHDPRVHLQSFAVPPPPTITYLAPPTQPAPTAANSSARFERRVRTTDLDLLVDAATAMSLPGLTDTQNLELLSIRPSILQAHFERDPESVSKWPGVEVYDHPIIVGR